ncbi:MAG: hypothetical protein GEV08_09090 [Acidimicrobiia bacterium]|nr:hypothetical protein [Acidimicrobiia bacterium]
MRRGAALVAGMVAVLAGCSGRGTGDDGGSGTATTASPAEVRPALERAVEQVLVPAYAALADTARELAGLTASLCAAPGEPSLAATLEAWREARTAWRHVQAVATGPIMDLRLMTTVDYAADPDKVADLAAGTEPVDVAGLHEVGSDRRGLTAVELLLGPEGVLGGPGFARRCTYAASAAEISAQAAETVSAAWAAGGEGEPPYRDTILERPTQAEADLLNELVFVLQAIAERRLPTALGVDGDAPDVAAADPGPLQRALPEMVEDLDGALAVYDALIAPSVARVSTGAATRVHDELAAARRQLAALPVPLATAVADEPEATAAALEATTTALRSLSTEVASLLGATLTFSDADGDS